MAKEKISAVYQIKNLINGRIYIGSTGDFRMRKNSHLSKLRKNKHTNYNMQDDFNILGEKAFVFSVIETTDSPMDREQHYLDSFSSSDLYNISTLATSQKGVKRRQGTLDKMRDSVLNNPHWLRGKNLPSEIKDKISNKNSGEGNGNSKLNKDKVQEIKEMLSNGFSNADIARKYNVDGSIISKIKSGKIWRSV